jgi:hypothetical protein
MGHRRSSHDDHGNNSATTHKPGEHQNPLHVFPEIAGIGKTDDKNDRWKEYRKTDKMKGFVSLRNQIHVKETEKAVVNAGEDNNHPDFKEISEVTVNTSSIRLFQTFLASPESKSQRMKIYPFIS